MLFNSLPFLIFFGIYFIFYLIIPLRYQLFFLIVGSTIFYGYWNPYYAFLPHILTLLSYFGVFWIMHATGSLRQWRLVAVIGALSLPLILIKYTNFLYNDVIGYALGLQKYNLNFPLPLSLSFVTFTLIAYVVDVYRERYPVENKLSTLSGLVLFFPHLIAGPILRPHELLPQLTSTKLRKRFLKPRVIFGGVFFTLGLLKKVIIADSLSPFVDLVYSSAAPELTLIDYWLAIYGFGVQIYCDFSGYTDMAIGIALMLGIQLPENFHQPYTAASIVEFWRRWHITLSNWLRDYIYIPLGGSRGHYGQQFVNILITMIIGGIWHGANWTFVLWGLLNGVGLVAVHAYRQSKFNFIAKKIPHWIAVFITFHFIMFTWIFFRAPNMTTVHRIFMGSFFSPFGDISLFLKMHLFPVGLIILFLFTHKWDSRRQIRALISKIPGPILLAILALIWILSLVVNEGSVGKFIYFDF